MRRAVSVMAVTGVAVALLAAPARAATPPLPNSMAALGDSITRAFDVCCYYGDHPSNPWATGGSPLDSIQSHYERLRALDPAIEGHQFNDAVTGAKMSDGARQAGQAVAQGAKYVTILLGANDLCTSSVSTMTSAATFRQQFEATMTTLDRAAHQRGGSVCVGAGQDLPVAAGVVQRRHAAPGRRRPRAPAQRAARRRLRRLRQLPLRPARQLQLPVQRGGRLDPRLLPPRPGRPAQAGGGHLGRLLVAERRVGAGRPRGAYNPARSDQGIRSRSGMARDEPRRDEVSGGK